MDVDAGCRVFHRPANVEVFGAGVARMDAALHADFGGAPRPGLAHAPFDLAERDIVWPTAQRLAHLAFGEGAEATFEITDVGVVDIAGNDVGNDVTVAGLPQLVGRRAQRLDRKSRFKGSHLGGAWLILFMIFNVIWTMLFYRGSAVDAHHFPYSDWAF